MGFTYGGYNDIFGAYERGLGEGEYTVHRPDHWLLAGTGLKRGEAFGKEVSLAGYEMDGCEFVMKDGLPVPTGRTVSPDGDLITNKHVVEETWNDLHAELMLKKLREEKMLDVKPTVWVFFGKTKHIAEIKHVSEKFDLAILKVDRLQTSFFPLGSQEAVSRGEPVFALGFPGAAQEPLTDEERRETVLRTSSGNSVEEQFKLRDFDFVQTTGTVSRMSTESMGRTWIQHNADINPGNSGGPLTSGKGVVLGINTLIVGGASGVSYSLSISQLQEEIKKHVSKATWR